MLQYNRGKNEGKIFFDLWYYWLNFDMRVIWPMKSCEMWNKSEIILGCAENQWYLFYCNFLLERNFHTKFSAKKQQYLFSTCARFHFCWFIFCWGSQIWVKPYHFYSKIGKNMGTPGKFNACRKPLEAFKWNFVKCCCQTSVEFRISVILFLI